MRPQGGYKFAKLSVTSHGFGAARGPLGSLPPGQVAFVFPESIPLFCRLHLVFFPYLQAVWLKGPGPCSSALDKSQAWPTCTSHHTPVHPIRDGQGTLALLFLLKQSDSLL